MKCKKAVHDKANDTQAASSRQSSPDDSQETPDWILRVSGDDQVKAVALMNQVIEDLPLGTNESAIFNEIKMRLRVEEFEAMKEAHKDLSTDSLQAKGNITRVVAKGYDNREVAITQGIVCLAYAAAGGITDKMQCLANILFRELNERSDRRMQKYIETLKAVLCLNHDAITDEQMKKRVDMSYTTESIDANTNTHMDIKKSLGQIIEMGETLMTSQNSVHRRLDGLKNNGKVGKRIGPEEQEMIYDIWQKWKKRIPCRGRKTAKKDVWENKTAQNKLKNLGVNSLKEFENAINAHEKSLANEEKMKKTRSRG